MVMLVLRLPSPQRGEVTLSVLVAGSVGSRRSKELLHLVVPSGGSLVWRLEVEVVDDQSTAAGDQCAGAGDRSVERRDVVERGRKEHGVEGLVLKREEVLLDPAHAGELVRRRREI
jgi:hypothetical protein